MSNERIKKYSADKIFLLGLFACSLLISWTIVKVRKNISLTKPIEIPYSGLSIKLPDKKGWISDKKWQFDNNSFVITGIFNLSKTQQMRLICTYQLASARESAVDWLNQIASKTNSKVTNSGQVSGFNVTFDWIYMEESKQFTGFLAAAAKLENGRWLDINVIQVGQNKNDIVELFEKIAQNIRLNENKLLQAGSELVKEIKDEGLSKYLYIDNMPSVYLIRNNAQRDVGFFIEAYLATNDEDTEIQMMSSLYLRRSELSRKRPLFNEDNYIDEGSFFQTDNYLKEYILNSQSNLSDETRITVSDSNYAEILSANQESVLTLGTAVMPNFVTDALFGIMFKNDINRILIDILSSRGKIIPAVISKSQNSLENNNEKLNVFEISYIDDNGFEKVYLDRNLQMIKKQIKQKNLELLIEKSTTDELIRRFPERADFIVERIKTIENTIL